MESSVQEVTGRDDEWSNERDHHGEAMGSDIPGRNPNDDRPGEWVEPPRDDGRAAGSNVQLELLPEPGALTSGEQLELLATVRTLTEEEHRKLRETLDCVRLAEAELPLAVEQTRARVDEWTTAVECCDRIAAARLAVLVTHQLHRLAVAADRAESQVAAGRLRDVAKWWTFQVLAVLDSLRSGTRLGADGAIGLRAGDE